MLLQNVEVLIEEGFCVSTYSKAENVKRFTDSQRPTTKERQYILISSGKDSQHLFEQLNLDANEVIVAGFVYCLNQNDISENRKWS